MLHVFKNFKLFTLLYFTVLIIDVLLKVYLTNIPYRYFTKLTLAVLLLGYYCTNQNENIKENKKWMFFFLTTIFVGDIMILHRFSFVFFIVSLIFFSLAKIFLSFRFTPKHNFNIVKLLPLSILFFAYTICIASIVYENIGDLLIPAIVCYFLSLLLFQFAVLRRRVFNKLSYLFVLLGVVLFIFAESMMAIQIFKTEFPFQKTLIILFYGSALYLIVVGVVKEKKIIDEDDISLY